MSKLLSDLQSELFETSCKLSGLAELLMFYEREPALDEGEVWHGVGLLLRELGEELRSRSRDIDEHQVRKAQRRKQQASPDHSAKHDPSTVHDRGQRAQKRSRK